MNYGWMDKIKEGQGITKQRKTPAERQKEKREGGRYESKKDKRGMKERKGT